MKNIDAANLPCEDEDDWFAGYESPGEHRAKAHPQCLPEKQTEAQGCKTPPQNRPSDLHPELCSPGPAIPHRKRPDFFPAFMSRSALFKAGRSSGDLLSPTDLPAQGCQLRAQGPRLTMKDKHVWETAIQIAKERADDLSSPFDITLREFAARMGSRDFNGKALGAIWNSLEKLATARVEFRTPDGWDGVGSMLSTAAKNGARFYVRLNPDFALPALAGDKQFKIRLDRRSRLGQALAQWLHDFFSTHSVARDLDLGYLRGLCGFDGPKRNFPEKLRLAMAELCSTAPELVAGFDIDQAGRDGDRWVLKIVRGAESPEFKPAEKRATPAPRQARRGGVAL